jgi:heme-degrading monooxygenase HmoA
MPVKLINCFDVPRAQDEFFAHVRQGTLMTSQPGFLGRRWHRAIAPDAHFRFINYASWESADAFRAALGQPAMNDFRAKYEAAGIRATFGLFEVVEDIGSIEPEPSSVLQISGFEFAAGGEAEFLSEFAQTKACMTSKEGFLAVRMHRAIAPETRYRFIDIARWASTGSFWAALRSSEMQALLARPFWKGVSYFAGIVEPLEHMGTI